MKNRQLLYYSWYMKKWWYRKLLPFHFLSHSMNRHRENVQTVVEVHAALCLVAKNWSKKLSNACLINIERCYSLRITESPLFGTVSKRTCKHDATTNLRNILLMKRSLFTGFLFLPFGTSVHIYTKWEWALSINHSRGVPTSLTFSRT